MIIDMCVCIYLYIYIYRFMMFFFLFSPSWSSWAIILTALVIPAGFLQPVAIFAGPFICRIS